MPLAISLMQHKYEQENVKSNGVECGVNKIVCLFVYIQVNMLTHFFSHLFI